MELDSYAPVGNGTHNSSEWDFLPVTLLVEVHLQCAVLCATLSEMLHE
jgi:hypothetical protein